MSDNYRKNNQIPSDVAVLLFSGVSGELESVESDRREAGAFIERLSETITKSQNDVNTSEKIEVIKRLSSLERFFDKEEVVLTRTESLLKNNKNNNQVIDQSKKLVEKIANKDPELREQVEGIKDKYF